MSSSEPYTRPHPYSIFTHSVGATLAGHSLLSKLRAIASAGFDGIELFQDDLDAFAASDEFRALQARGDALISAPLAHDTIAAFTPPDSPRNHNRRRHSGSSTASDSSTTSTSATSYTAIPVSSSSKGLSMTSLDNDLLVRTDRGELVIGSDGLPMTYNAWGECTTTTYRQELAAASYIASFCDSLGLAIYSLQPLRDFEGWAKPEDQQLALRRARSRFEIMRMLGADLLLICSNNQHAPATVGDVERIGSDLAQLGRYAEHFGPICTSYRASVDGTMQRQEKSIRVGYEALSWGAHVDVWARAWQAVQHADRGNVGLILDSFNTLAREYADPCTKTGITDRYDDPYAAVMQSIGRLSSVPAHKIFFLQIGDARRMPEPLKPSPNAEEPRPARMIWSRGNRLFPCEYEQGAFMPTTEFVQAAVTKAGYRGPWSIEVFNSSLSDQGEEVPAHHAMRARAGLDRLVEEVFA
ncbi:Xylose isomerase-like, TIM barrel domain protein [Kalmanozyma brasiliensis GHG001]|uniref:Xylose isomerase-like TIM barrel domain-containing protein n=1 Tax=Kalmanozyma brasiliensis (strain GHG001) TaxID=1365824 RepID=V5EVW6_KALBG|nr:Xylose isomerase-like, TIM barrel domain protein [Kalmanozyma brasiliensis GHG001]EST09635.1 Xylose isomerase-like, TIM barrel domain protein [Kalmanozyma brasiliensis GHG001]